MGSDCILLDVKCFLLREINEQQSSLALDTSSFLNASSLNGVGSVEMSNDSSYDRLGYSNATHDNATSSDAENDDIGIPDIILVLLFCLLIVVTIFGNTLVILSVITTRRLRTVTNCFVMSLAVADWLVGVFVLPPAVYSFYMKDAWHLGWILCDIWISLDVLLCTASILSLCAISIDRYLAVTQPLNYSRRRRSKRLALYMIFIVWMLAFAITCPPILGWHNPERRNEIEESEECGYNDNKGYVVFSAMGSFFIPMLVMVYVYLRISCVVANRHDDMVQIKVHQNSARTREICANDFESENENRVRQNHPQHQQHRLTDQSMTTSIGTSQRGSPILPDQDLVKKIEKLEHEEARNGHYELVHVGKTQSESNMKLNSTLKTKDCKNCRDKTSEKNASLTNVNGNNNSNDSANGNQQSSNNFYLLRSRTQAKSLSTRISSLKRESKTTRTLSIVMFVFIGCWLPFFIHYLLVPFFPGLKIPLLGRMITWLGWINSCLNPFIYAAYSEDFRAAFYRLTLRKICISTQKKPHGYPLTSVSARR